ncbi:unnamed protein product [Larinioides sclopetarius]|uniref:MATH domain-containing protein n=1 Tax=Larinioides sclopetarius TaxID=280406 RepID=A0AAV1ZTJ0_9ARAC
MWIFFVVTVFEFLSYVLFPNYWCFILIFPVVYIVLKFHKGNFTSAKTQENEKHLDTSTIYDSNAKVYTFRWKVEKLSYCWLKKGESIKSPTFTVDSLESTKWSLELYPKGSSSNNNFVSVFLKREKDYRGPKVIELKYQLAFLNKKGLILNIADVWGDRFKKDYIGIRPLSETREKVFVTERETFLPEDILTIQCKLWKENEKPVVSELLSARTIFDEHRGAFVWRIDCCSIVEYSLFSTISNLGILSFLIREMGNGLLEFDFRFNKKLKFLKIHYLLISDHAMMANICFHLIFRLLILMG